MENQLVRLYTKNELHYLVYNRRENREKEERRTRNITKGSSKNSEMETRVQILSLQLVEGEKIF